MLQTVVYPDLTRDLRYFGRLLGHYGPVRYKRTSARAWRVVTVLGGLGYARTEADAKRLLVELTQC